MFPDLSYVLAKQFVISQIRRNSRNGLTYNVLMNIHIVILEKDEENVCRNYSVQTFLKLLVVDN